MPPSPTETSSTVQMYNIIHNLHLKNCIFLQLTFKWELLHAIIFSDGYEYFK